MLKLRTLLSRENIVKQARNLKGLALPTLMPGITINTGPDNSMAYTQLQLQRWTGSSWEQFGGVQSAGAVIRGDCSMGRKANNP